ncbi:MAG: hypothetical protein IT582_01160 [Opitutaceae bacterium]|nr:hypothetical protein [Opitutaceae bacterium]
MDESLWIIGLRLAGVMHFGTVALAWFTPIPPGWEENLAKLPRLHRRFALAQNASIGAVIVVFGLFSLCFAESLIGGAPLGRAVCGATALFWGGRVLVLPWIGVVAVLRTPLLRAGFALLCAECVIYATAYGWLALR